MKPIRKALELFFASYISVFLMGFSVLAVNHNNFFLAWCISLGIGISQFVIMKRIPHKLSNLELTGYLLGGPFGVVSGMYMYKLFF